MVEEVKVQLDVIYTSLMLLGWNTKTSEKNIN